MSIVNDGSTVPWAARPGRRIISVLRSLPPHGHSQAFIEFKSSCTHNTASKLPAATYRAAVKSQGRLQDDDL